MLPRCARAGVSVVGTPIVFELTNGTYHYGIGTEPGYTGAGSPKPARVDGAPLDVTVTFTKRS